MKKIKRASSLLLALVIALAMIPVCFADEVENPYVSIDLSEGVLNAKPATLSGAYNVTEIATAQLSLATAEIFMQSIEDTTNKKAMYTLCKKNSTANLLIESGWEQKRVSIESTFESYSQEIYEQLKKGIPVLVNRAGYGNYYYVSSAGITINQYYRSTEWAIIVGYSGSETELEPDNFMIVDVSPSSDTYSHCTLSYWLGMSDVSDIAIRQDGLDFTSVWENDFSVKSATYKIVDNEVVFTVTTAPNFNRVKVTYADALVSYISYSSEYTVKDSGEYVFTLKAPFVAGTTKYAFDGRRSDTNKYAQNYFYKTAELDESEINTLIMNVGHEVKGDNVIFTIITQSGNFDRIKLTTADALTGSLGVDKSYEVNADGNYVWTIKEPLPNENTTYAFDLRNADTGKYTKGYAYYELELEGPSIISASHIISDGKLVLTVETTAGDYNRLKVTTADNLKGSLSVANKYTVNADGNYVWTIKADVPTENTSFAFDLRSSTSGAYLKDYYYYEVEAKTPTILSASHEIVGKKIVFTVVTTTGNYDRIKATLADNLGGSIAVGKTYTVDENGNYVWTIKATASAEETAYAFDLRIADGRYIKDYYYYTA